MTKAEPAVIGIVDDDHAVRESLRFLLEIAGHAVETFASAAEFLEANVYEFACLILDHHMPHMTGLELVKTLRADGSAIPILLMTGMPSPNIYTQAAELDIHTVLEKPLDEKDLLDFLNLHRP